MVGEDFVDLFLTKGFVRESHWHPNAMKECVQEEIQKDSEFGSFFFCVRPAKLWPALLEPRTILISYEYGIHIEIETT